MNRLEIKSIWFYKIQSIQLILSIEKFFSKEVNLCNLRNLWIKLLK